MFEQIAPSINIGCIESPWPEGWRQCMSAWHYTEGARGEENVCACVRENGTGREGKHFLCFYCFGPSGKLNFSKSGVDFVAFCFGPCFLASGDHTKGQKCTWPSHKTTQSEFVSLVLVNLIKFQLKTSHCIKFSFEDNRLLITAGVFLDWRW